MNDGGAQNMCLDAWWRLNGEAARPVSARRCRLGEVTGQVVLLMLRVRSANPDAAMTVCLPCLPACGRVDGGYLSWANLG